MSFESLQKRIWCAQEATFWEVMGVGNDVSGWVGWETVFPTAHFQASYRGCPTV